MNPKNILKLLRDCFDQEMYDIESIITREERDFASLLEIIIKDVINDSLFVETYETLAHENDFKQPDPVLVEEEFDEGLEEVKTESNEKKLIPIPIEYKERTVAFWRSGKKKRRKFETVQSKYVH